MANTAELRKKAYIDFMGNQEVPLSTQNVEVVPDMNIAPKNEDNSINDITTNAAQEILNKRKQPKVETNKTNAPQDGEGFDIQKIGEGALNLIGSGASAAAKGLGSIPTSTLLGITAGTEAGSRDPNQYLASAYGKESEALRKQEAEQNVATKKAMLNPDNQIVNIQDEKTGDVHSVLVNKYTGEQIKDLGKTGFAGSDYGLIDIAGQKALAMELAKGKAEAQTNYAGASAGANASKQELQRVLELNKNSVGGLAADAIIKTKGALGGKSFTPEEKNTIDLVNSLKTNVVENLKKTFGGQLSDSERSYLDEQVYGATAAKSPAEREIFIKNIMSFQDRKLSEVAGKAGVTTENTQVSPQSNDNDPLGLGI